MLHLCMSVYQSFVLHLCLSVYKSFVLHLDVCRVCLQKNKSPVYAIPRGAKFTIFFCLFRFFRNRFVCFGCFDMCSKHRNKPKNNFFLVSRNKPKNNRNRLCFGSFRFKPKIFFVCFEDTLLRGIQTSDLGVECDDLCGWVELCDPQGLHYGSHLLPRPQIYALAAGHGRRNFKETNPLNVVFPGNFCWGW
jgi:hypothetical protein